MRAIEYFKVTICRGLLVAGALVLTTACGQAKVQGHAMEPAFPDGERVPVTSVIDSLNRGDVVTFRYPVDESKHFMKRIIGLPGEQVEAKDGVITINGQQLDESYVVEANRSHDTWGPQTIPADEYFMLGDNRRNSSDSRYWGTVRRSLITGKVVRP
jgi:signal peptidase I